MPRRLLVAYASRAGSTAEVAETVGQVLRKAGCDVDVRSVKDVPSLIGYDGLVLGSAIWVGKPLSEAVRFVSARRQELANIPAAYFILCDRLAEDTPPNRDVARTYLAPLERLKQPISRGLFAGVKDFSTVQPWLRWLLTHVVKLPEGDWRNWEKIRAWATTLVPLIANLEPAATG